jgi:Uncharacterized protein/domain associated with GTPases
MTNKTFDPGKIVEESINKALKQRGEVNILVAGKTGVGKSTLINAVFQGNFATTGQGKPVTLFTREIKKEGIPLTLFDTRGLELKEFETTISELEKLIQSRRSESNPHRHIHAAWICIDENSRRIEDAEIRLSELLSRYMPVIGVITKSFADNGFRSKVQELLPQTRNVVRVNSLPQQLDDGHIIRPFGLIELVDVTMEVVPEGHQMAFAAAQKVSIQQKKNKAHGIVASSATAAAAAGATPIPFADATVLIPIQIGMLAGITAVFGLDIKKSLLLTLLSSLITGTGATLLGRTIVANLTKFIPGAGSVTGGVISAATASTVTIAFGEAYIATLEYLVARKELADITSEDIIGEFKKRFQKKKK